MFGKLLLHTIVTMNHNLLKSLQLNMDNYCSQKMKSTTFSVSEVSYLSKKFRLILYTASVELQTYIFEGHFEW